MVWKRYGEHSNSYDARGLMEPFAAVPKVSAIDGDTAESMPTTCPPDRSTWSCAGS